ncbi:DUF4333 domain-containing protein [Nocardia sp. NPDC020380]|uniref:DUF4333 domain-containing protein n=1 Tax=Nocardia sp. NPDC020380 TaxID=3364309 RepID=UPI0037A9FC77
MRKFSAVFLIAAVPLVASGCFGPGSVDKSDIQTKVAGFYHDESHEDAKSTTCEGDLKAEVGAQQKCTVTAGNGQTWPVTVKATKVEDKTVDYEETFDSKYLKPDDVAKEVARIYNEQTGKTAKATSCTGLLPGATGTTLRCVATEDDGTRWGVTATTTNIEGDQINYTVKFDDSPMP